MKLVIGMALLGLVGVTSSRAFAADPKPAAANIKGYFAFWKGVTVER